MTCRAGAALPSTTVFLHPVGSALVERLVAPGQERRKRWAGRAPARRGQSGPGRRRRPGCGVEQERLPRTPRALRRRSAWRWRIRASPSTGSTARAPASAPRHTRAWPRRAAAGASARRRAPPTRRPTCGSSATALRAAAAASSRRSCRAQERHPAQHGFHVARRRPQDAVVLGQRLGVAARARRAAWAPARRARRGPSVFAREVPVEARPALAAGRRRRRPCIVPGRSRARASPRSGGGVIGRELARCVNGGRRIRDLPATQQDVAQRQIGVGQAR